MGKTFVFILLFALLGFGVYFFLFKERELFSSDEASFKISDTASVSKIFLADKNGGTITLTRSGGEWLLNNEFAVANHAITILLSTMAAQEAAFPVPETKHNTVIKLLSAKSVKVELYNRSGDKFRVFYVGGQADNEEGSYMLMEGATRAYVVHIPGFPGYLLPRYSTTFEDWRSRLVCNVPIDDLKQVSVAYPNEPLNSYSLDRTQDGTISVSLDESLNFKETDFNKGRAESYAGFFRNLYSEGYINGTQDLDNIIKNVPKRCIVDIASWSGDAQHMEVYWMPLNKRSKNQVTPLPDAPNDFDADRFYAVINNFKDTVIIQRQVFEKIFRKGYEFYQNDNVDARDEAVPLEQKVVQ